MSLQDAKIFDSHSALLKPALAGCENIRRKWCISLQNVVVKVNPGEFYATINNELITTVLGSCVSACVRDPVAGIGGMNHFMLPGCAVKKSGSWDISCPDTVNRYGHFAMNNLIRILLRNGAEIDRLEVKLFGGAKVLDMSYDVGTSNTNFVRAYLAENNLYACAEDLGGTYARKLIFSPADGRVKMRKITSTRAEKISDTEKKYLHCLESTI